VGKMMLAALTLALYQSPLRRIDMKHYLSFFYLVAAIASMAFKPSVAAQLSISPEAERSAVVDVVCPDCVTADLFPSPYTEQTLPGISEAISYIGFDLKALLPEGASISSAKLNVFDLNIEVDDQFVHVALLDVPSDWDPASLTFDMAKARYGATRVDTPNVAVAVDPEKVLWQGRVAMNLEFQPGRATVGSRAIFESVTPSTDAQLIAAMNESLTLGDGFITFALYGDTLDDNNMVGIDFTDGEPGPTLTLQVLSAASAGETIVFDFDGQDPASWEAVQISETENGPGELGSITTQDPKVGNSVPPTPLSGSGFIGPVPFEADDGTNTRDKAHETLVYRSPEFKMFPNGEISFGLIGGAKPGFDIDEINQNGLPAESSGGGSIGVALRQATSGKYLTFNTRSENGSQSWETIILGEDVLGDVIETGESYTLDFIDYHSGGWGWAGLDNVIIKKGTPQIQYDFDDETLQGWTQVSVSDHGPNELGVISVTDPKVGNSVPPAPLNAPAFVGPVPFEDEDGTNTRDTAHSTLVLRSPAFHLYGDGEISFALIGGAKPGFNLDEINANGLPSESSGGGSIGVGLRKASTGEYLSFHARSESGSQAWETIILTQEDFGGKIEEGELYTLDFIDYHSGGWGWAGMDDVIIRPGTMPASVPVDIEGVSIQGDAIVIHFTGQLESATSVDGPWTPLDSASSPYSEVITGISKFFRVVE
jgi:hypothetical protein